MFRSAATIAPSSSPVLTDWTIQELLEWIGEDDARCHDTTLIGVLAEIDGSLGLRAGAAASVLPPRSAAPLVRSIASRLRAEPALRDTRLRELSRPTDVAESRATHTITRGSCELRPILRSL